jgi:hypothetical protein
MDFRRALNELIERHRRGELSDEAFARAKLALLEDGADRSPAPARTERRRLRPMAIVVALSLVIALVLSLLPIR